MNIATSVPTDITPKGTDYDTVSRVIEMLTEDYRDQPSLETVAHRLKQSPTQLQKVFTRWAGLSPKAFLQAVTLDHAKRLLRQEDMPLLETSIEVDACQGRAACTTCSSPTRRCRPANGRRAAPA